MNLVKISYLLNAALVCLVAVGCCRSTPEVWEDTKSCSRHLKRGLCTLGGKQNDSRAVRCPEEFYCMQNSYEDDFIPLIDDEQTNRLGATELSTPQPNTTPGDPGSPVPGIEAFRDPATNPQLATIFENVHFEYNQNLVKGQENIAIVKNIAAYLRSHPNTYVFVEGHCDERGPEAYNLALGSRRANAVRNMLVQDGVNPDHVFTISYGKERPLILDPHEEGWAQNRRAEFKVYQR